MAGAERRLSVRPALISALAAGACLSCGALPCHAQAPLPTQPARVDPDWSRVHAPAPPAKPRARTAGRADAGAAGTPRRPSPFAAALAAAWKKGVVEDAVAGYTEVLVACQQEQSMLQTTPFMRSDSQQAHCYRY